MASPGSGNGAGIVRATRGSCASGSPDPKVEVERVLSEGSTALLYPEGDTELAADLNSGD